MDYKEPKQTPEPVYEDQPAAMEGSISMSAAAIDPSLDSTVAAMAMAMANLMGPTEAAALNEAAAVLMEGGNDGDA